MSQVYMARRGGGGGLLLKVTGGLQKPANPQEGTIWIKTETAISSWTVADKAPAAAEGAVWIRAGAQSPGAVNIAPKENPVYIYPAGVRQYIGGEWTAKTGESYTGGSWKNWDAVLYMSGNYGLAGDYAIGNGGPEGISLLKEPTLRLDVPKSAGQPDFLRIFVNSRDRADVSPYKTLSFKARARGFGDPPGGNGYNAACGLSLAKNGNFAASLELNSEQWKEYKLDIEALSGEYYLCFICGTGWNYPNSIEFESIRLLN